MEKNFNRAITSHLATANTSRSLEPQLLGARLFEIGQEMCQIVQIAVLESVQGGGHDGVAPEAGVVAKLLHGINQKFFLLSGQPWNLLPPGVVGQMAGAAQHIPGDVFAALVGDAVHGRGCPDRCLR